MATTAQQIVDKARRYLRDDVPGRNIVLGHTNNGDGTQTMQFKYELTVGGISEGSRLACGLQTWFVYSVNANNQTAVVAPDEGTTALLAGNSTVLVDPRFTGYSLFQAANDCLNDLSTPESGLYQMKIVEFPFSAARVGYDLGPELVQSIYQIQYQNPGPFKNWRRLNTVDWRLDRNANLTDFPSGQSLSLYAQGFQSYKVQVDYKTAFGQFALPTDTLATVGLAETASDLLALGTAINVMIGGEVARNDTSSQGSVRRASEVPAGAVANSVRLLQMKYQQRLTAEAGRLMRAYPNFVND